MTDLDDLINIFDQNIYLMMNNQRGAEPPPQRGSQAFIFRTGPIAGPMFKFKLRLFSNYA